MANLGTEGFKKGTKEIERAVKSLSSTAKRFGSTMTGSIKRLVPMILGVGSAYQVISKGVSAFMAQNEALSARMSAIWTAVGNLLGPIITQIIDWVSTAVSYFLGFLKLLGITGKSASELSKAAKKGTQELQRTIAGFDELNVLQDSSGGGGGADNPLKDLEPKEWMKALADLLKNKLWDQAADMIVGKVNEIIYRIRDKAFEAGQQIGEYLGGIFHIIARLIRDVDWNALGDTVAKLFNGLISKVDGKDLGTLLVGKFVIAIRILTGFLENLDWEQTAQLVSDAIVGIFESLGEAIEKADFKKIGEGIRKFFTRIYENQDETKEALYGFLKAAWEAALDLFSGLLGDSGGEHPLIESIRNLFSSLQEFAETLEPIIDHLWHDVLEPAIDWIVNSGLPIALDRISGIVDDITAFLSGDIGLAEFIGRIQGELTGFIEDILLSLNGLLEDLTGIDFIGWASLLWESIKEAWGNIKEWWHEVAFEDGKFVIAGLFEGILEKVKNIASWVKTTIVDPFVKGFKEAFGIQSPSTVMAEIGGFIIEGLLNGIKALLPDFDAIKETIIAGFENVRDKVTGFLESINPFKSDIDTAAQSTRELAEQANHLAEVASHADEALYDMTGTSAYTLQECEKAQSALSQVYEELASRLGISTEELMRQIDAVGGDVTQIEALGAAIENTGNAMERSAGQYEAGSEAYNEASKKVAESSQEAAKVVSDSTAVINEATSENTEAAAANATANSKTMQENTTGEFDTMKAETTDTADNMKTDVGKSFEEMNTEASDQAKDMKNNVVSYTTQMKDEALMQMSIMFSGAYSIFSQLAYNAGIWGQDLMINFVNGINGMIPALVDTLIGIANIVNSYIGFSLPEKGPLSDFDKSGPDMIELFAEGMRGETGKLVTALNDIAETVSFQAPGIAGGAILPYSVSASSGSGGGIDSSEALEVLRQLASDLNEVKKEMNNVQFVAQFDNLRAVARKISQIQRQMERAEGV